MFVTINAKHTRLNASHLVTLSGRQLYLGRGAGGAHDVVRVLNDREESPLHGGSSCSASARAGSRRRRWRRS